MRVTSRQRYISSQAQRTTGSSISTSETNTKTSNIAKNIITGVIVYLFVSAAIVGGLAKSSIGYTNTACYIHLAMTASLVFGSVILGIALSEKPDATLDQKKSI